MLISTCLCDVSQRITIFIWLKKLKYFNLNHTTPQNKNKNTFNSLFLSIKSIKNIHTNWSFI